MVAHASGSPLHNLNSEEHRQSKDEVMCQGPKSRGTNFNRPWSIAFLSLSLSLSIYIYIYIYVYRKIDTYIYICIFTFCNRFCFLGYRKDSSHESNPTDPRPGN